MMMVSAGEGWGEGERFLSIQAGFLCREHRGIGGTAVKRAFAIHGTLGENIVFSTVLQRFHQHPGVPDSSVPRQKKPIFLVQFLALSPTLSHVHHHSISLISTAGEGAFRATFKHFGMKRTFFPLT